MAKMIAILMLFVLAFGGVLAGMLAMTGNLSQDAVKKLLGQEEAPVELGSVPVTDDVAEKAIDLKEREEEIALREAQLRTKEERVQDLIQQNETLRDEVSQLIAQLGTSMEEADADQQKRLQDVAASLEKMKAQQAALTLQNWTPEDAARVLLLMGERQRGSILDSMEPETASRFLKAIQQAG